VQVPSGNKGAKFVFHRLDKLGLFYTTVWCFPLNFESKMEAYSFRCIQLCQYLASFYPSQMPLILRGEVCACFLRVLLGLGK